MPASNISDCYLYNYDIGHWTLMESGYCDDIVKDAAFFAGVHKDEPYVVIGWSPDIHGWATVATFNVQTGGAAASAAVPPPQPPNPPAQSDWKEIPANCDEVPIKKDYWYSALASIDVAKDKVLSIAAGAGLVITSYKDRPDLTAHKPGYRVIAITGYASRDAGTMRTCVPSPADIVDDSRAIKIWFAAPGKAPISGVTPSSMWTPVLVGTGLVAAAGAGWYWWWRTRKERATRYDLAVRDRRR